MKFEPIGGDDTRAWRRAEDDGAPIFDATNVGKDCRELDPHSASDAQMLREHLRLADVLIINLLNSSQERHGLTSDALARDFPQLVVSDVSAFGPVGPKTISPATTRWCRP